MKKLYNYLVSIIVILNCINLIIPYNSKLSIPSINLDSTKSDRLQRIKEKGVLTIAASDDRPFAYIDPRTGKFIGVDADIMSEIAMRLGINKIEMKKIPFQDLIEQLNTDDSIDIIADGMYITKEREQLVSFTEPMYKESEAIITLKASRINFKEDLKNATVGASKGTEFLNLAQKWKADGVIKDIVIYDTQPELLFAVNTGEIDAAITDSIVASYLLSNNKNLFLKSIEPYKPELPGLVAAAVRKSDITLLKAINDQIDQMKANRFLYGILKQNGLNQNNFV